MTLRVSTTYPEGWRRLAGLPLLAQEAWYAAMRGRLDGQAHWFSHIDGRLLASAPPAGGLDAWAEPIAAGLAGLVVATAGAYTYGNLHALLLAPDAPLASEPVRRALARDPVPSTAVLPNLMLTYPGYASFAVGSRATDHATLRSLLADIVAWARERGLAAVALPYAYTSGPLATAAGDLGFAAAALTSEAWLEVPPGGLAQLLGRLTGHRRRRIQAERRHLRAVGLSSRLVDHFDAELLGHLGRLRALHRSRYALASDVAAEVDRLTRLVGQLGAAATATVVAAPGEAPVCFALQARDGAVWHQVCCGTDYADPRSRFAYFEATFYAPVELAGPAGIREISFGIAAEEAKLRRGARLVPLSALLLGLTAPARAAAAAMSRCWATIATPMTTDGPGERG